MRSDELFGSKQREVSLTRNQIELSIGTKNSKPREIPLLPRAPGILARMLTRLRSPYVLINSKTSTRYLQLSFPRIRKTFEGRKPLFELLRLLAQLAHRARRAVSELTPVEQRIGLPGRQTGDLGVVREA
jgi:hypothetical protein